MTVAGLAATFGSGAMTNSIDEIEYTDLILATGTNTTENHPVIGAKVKRAVKQQGAKLIVIDPRKIDLVKYADIWLCQKPGTDVAVLNGLMNVILSEGLEAKDYIKERTEGFDALKAVVAKYTPEYVEKISGVKAEDLKKAGEEYAAYMIRELLDGGAPGIHLYTMNKLESTKNILKLAGLR